MISFETTAVILSAIAAILAWIAKLRWSNEYEKAKEERLKAKDDIILSLKQQIETLKEISPTKLKEQFLSAKSILEEYTILVEKKSKRLQNQISDDESQRMNILKHLLENLNEKNDVFIEQLDIFRDEMELIKEAIKNDSFPVPSLLITPNEAELEKFSEIVSLEGIPRSRRSVEFASLWIKELRKSRNKDK